MLNIMRRGLVKWKRLAMPRAKPSMMQRTPSLQVPQISIVRYLQLIAFRKHRRDRSLGVEVRTIVHKCLELESVSWAQFVYNGYILKFRDLNSSAIVILTVWCCSEVYKTFQNGVGQVGVTWLVDAASVFDANTSMSTFEMEAGLCLCRELFERESESRLTTKKGDRLWCWQLRCRELVAMKLAEHNRDPE